MIKHAIPMLTYQNSDLSTNFSADECTDLPELPSIETKTSFPVILGTVVKLRCPPGHDLQGDSEITCVKGRKYNIVNQPSCRVCFLFCILCSNYSDLATRPIFRSYF